MKRKVLVCGASGFIGRNIAEHLAENESYEVYGTYLKSKPRKNRRIKMLRVDLTDDASVRKVTRGMDVIMQAAATTSGAKDIINKPYYHVTDNALMNSLIFRAAYVQKVARLIFFSCTVMYQSSDSPLKEADFDASREIYPSYFGVGWTKVYLEKMCEFYSRIGDTRYTVIRHSNIYGPYDKYNSDKSHVFAATLSKVMNAKDGSKIVVWGSGEEERDLLHVEDLISFVESVVDKQKNKFETFNVGLGTPFSVNKLVEKIIAHSGKRLGVEHDLSKPSIKTKLCLDCAKAKDLIGWAPGISLDEGIRKTIRWYEENIQLT